MIESAGLCWAVSWWGLLKYNNDRRGCLIIRAFFFAFLCSRGGVCLPQVFTPSQTVVDELEALMRMLFSETMCGFGDSKVPAYLTDMNCCIARMCCSAVSSKSTTSFK